MAESKGTTADLAPDYYAFTWAIPDSEFVWWYAEPTGDGTPITELWREPFPNSKPLLLPASRPTAWRTYRPFEEYTGLFMAFTHTRPARAELASFANQYGQLEDIRSLGGPGAPRRALVQTPWGEQYRAVWEEEWSHEHRRLSAAVTAFRVSAESSDVAALRRQIQETLTYDLASHVTPALTARNVALMPTTLLGVMWLQLALAVVRSKSYRECQAHACPRRWFEISTDPFGLRPDAQFCSDRCRARAKAYRRFYRDRVLSTLSADVSPVSPQAPKRRRGRPAKRKVK